MVDGFLACDAAAFLTGSVATRKFSKIDTLPAVTQAEKYVTYSVPSKQKALMKSLVATEQSILTEHRTWLI
jgi:hypothetical protein